MRQARIASLNLRENFFSGVSSNDFATCWVMVLPPWTIPPAMTFLPAARRMEMKSIPEC